ncbi:class A beta-lactamase [Paraburkholderia bonniea]|uniref:class A beta-lactamase n=1 Tax=Paraburkholderia bonniea TaxID=2152891 RepID=UPI002572D677|nr:class A beta-lactamase [Paraburkholderia bonniea]WJF92140.1 class A beta-lactamase [Paraburkholderia bonniea]WJF95460.1 class A beta-lactamase [Paraburkholderia bonniea]
MNHSPTRRKLLCATASWSFASLCAAQQAPASQPDHPASPVSASIAGNAKALTQLQELERSSGGRLGVLALDLTGHVPLSYRADERFPLCSTFKTMLAAAILQRSRSAPSLLAQQVQYRSGELASYSPVTRQHVEDGMSVGALCAAALQYSDNTAANLLLKILGGPAAVTAFARSLGDNLFRLDRWEPELNSATPGDPRDTSTPAAMAHSLQRLLLGDALGAAQRTQLRDWMLANTTGAARIRAGVPPTWQVADKTGTGDYGTTGDIAVLWPPGMPPVTLALYFTQPGKDAKARDDVLAAATRVLVSAMG